jgi:hypothetical protein
MMTKLYPILILFISLSASCFDGYVTWNGKPWNYEVYKKKAIEVITKEEKKSRDIYLGYFNKKI